MRDLSRWRVQCVTCKDFLCDPQDKETMTCTCGRTIVDHDQIYIKNLTKNNEKEYPLYHLDMLIKSINELPSDAMHAYINHYDFNCCLVLIRDVLENILKERYE